MIFMITNTDLGVLEWCVDSIGTGRVVRAKSTEKNPRRLPCYRYVLDAGNAIRDLLPRLRPYLKIKAKQADAAITYLESRALRLPRSAFNETEINLFFDIRLANQRAYNSTVDEARITYKKIAYNRANFRELILRDRTGSVYRVVEWTPEMDALVGTDIDRKIAERLGLKLAQVQRRREHLGRVPFGWVAPAKRLEIQRLRREEHMTMIQIAQATGVSFSSVQRALADSV
jgi:hypothetical protein